MVSPRPHTALTGIELSTMSREFPMTGGFALLLPEDADYAVEVCRRQDSVVTCRVQLRLEPEHGPGPRPARPDG